MKSIHKIHIYFFIIFFSASVLKAEEPDSIKTYVLNPVVITATNLEVLRNTVPNAVTVVSNKVIEESGENSILPVLNKYVPGLFVSERGILGYGIQTGAGTINIRGVGGNPNTGVLVLTDGRPQMMGIFGHPLPDSYVTSDIERVEVIRGPASILHGTNSMGGVINIISKKNYDPGLNLKLGSSFGSYNTQKYETNFGYGFGNASISASANHYFTDGHRPNSSFRTTNGSVRGHINLSEFFKLSADFNITSFKTYDPGTVSMPAPNNWMDVTRGSSGLALENLTGNFHGALKLFYNFGKHNIYDGFHSIDNNIGFSLYQGIYLLDGNVTTAGIDYKEYGGEAENKNTGFNFGKFFNNELGIYVLSQQKLLRILTVTAGIRYNKHNVYGDEVIPQAGISLQINNTTIRANASKGYRNPTIRELYLFPAPTLNLQPELLYNYEIGFLHSFSRIINFEITAFTSEGNNIIRVEGMPPNLSLKNSGKFVHRGIEFSARYIPDTNFNLIINYSYLDPGNQTFVNPENKFFLGSFYKYSKFTFNTGIQYITGLYGADFKMQPLPDYILASARINYSFLNNFSLYVSGENLLNKDYQTLPGYPMPGATFFIGINWGTY